MLFYVFQVWLRDWNSYDMKQLPHTQNLLAAELEDFHPQLHSFPFNHHKKKQSCIIWSHLTAIPIHL